MAAYHERELNALLEHLREGFARLDAGELDAFDPDELIHRYKRSARELWKFCNLGRPGRSRTRATSTGRRPASRGALISI